MFGTNGNGNRNGHIRSLAALTMLFALLLPTLSVTVRAAHTDTNVGGPIISDTTWTLANSPYTVIANVQVMTGITLTIEPGVVVKFDAGKLLQVDGTLIARGTASQRITFTSSKASPAKGDWGNIAFSDSSVDATFDSNGNYLSGSVLQYCVVEYGGSGSSIYGAIQTISASPLIDHCTVRNNNKSGIYAVGTSGTPVVIRYNTVSDNSAYYGAGGIAASPSTIIGNTVNGNSSSGYGASGGISVSSSTVTGNTVSNNSASGGFYASGGGIGAFNNSMVTSNIVSGNWVSFGGGGICADGSTVTGNTVSSNSASDGGGGIYAYYNSTVTGNTVSGNSAPDGGGINAWDGMVTGNTVSGNSAIGGVYRYGYGGGIYARDGTVTGNTVSGNSAINGGGIYARGTVMSNTVAANSVSVVGQGSGVYYYSSSPFLYNTIVGNTAPTGIIGGVAIKGTPQFHYNNLYGNSNYDAVVLSSSDISGTNNYWGTTNSVNILAQVYDWYDDATRGRLLYIPYLQDPSPNAPVPPPRNLRANFASSSANLSWDPIPSTTTGYGYKVYYDNDVSGPPYSGTGATQGNSPIDVGNSTNYALTGLLSRTYYIAVTAYDTQGRESWYSNEVNNVQRLYLPILLKNH